MIEKDVLLVQSTFKEYYFNRFDLIHVPQRATEREFGYQKFNSGMTRHLVVKNDKELHLLLMKRTWPFHAEKIIPYPSAALAIIMPLNSSPSVPSVVQQSLRLYLLAAKIVSLNPKKRLQNLLIS